MPEVYWEQGRMSRDLEVLEYLPASEGMSEAHWACMNYSRFPGPFFPFHWLKN